MISLKTDSEIEKIHSAGRIVAGALQVIGENLRPGITTGELDGLANDYIERKGGKAAFKGYHGYPANTCISINEQVVHGIPGERQIEAGQLVSVDIGVLLEGYYGDSAYTFLVDGVSPEAKRLAAVTEEALRRGIENARPGNYLTDISWAIQSHVESRGFSVVRDLVGHGVGKRLHEDPQIPNYGKPGAGPLLREGMVLAIEPMVNQGGHEIETLKDHWTVVTRDGSLSAHFEHTVVVTSNGPRILTKV
jgi:methionyl aminopeptidase